MYSCANGVGCYGCETIVAAATQTLTHDTHATIWYHLTIST